MFPALLIPETLQKLFIQPQPPSLTCPLKKNKKQKTEQNKAKQANKNHHTTRTTTKPRVFLCDPDYPEFSVDMQASI